MTELPKLRIRQRDFEALPEYSATYPTGQTPGKRWKRLDGSHDHNWLRAGGIPRWYILEYGQVSPDGKTISILRYRPVIIPEVRA